MKLLYKYYSKFRKHRINDLRTIVRAEIIQNSIKQVAFSSTDSLINEGERNTKIVVTLTSFGKRLRSLYLVLESIAQQTLKPDEIILWLNQIEFDDESIPITLRTYEKRGLKINYCKDIGSHTKLFYAIKEYPDDTLITIDDDVIYPNDLIENLYKTYLENPKTICCNAAKKIPYLCDKLTLPYYKWQKISDKKRTGINLLPLGVNGVLYFPGCFDQEVFNVEVLKKLCPKADDIWFRMMTLKKNVNVTVTGAYSNLNKEFIPLDTSYISALAVLNIKEGGNDRQIKDVIDYYNLGKNIER